jgi:phospholipid/cholesterol/gamma-HCH transport system permease protein
MTSMVRLVGAQALLLARALTAMTHERPAGRAVTRQLRTLGTGSAPLIAMGLTFFGMVLTAIAWAQARKYTGNISVVGPVYLELIVREFAPMLVALLAASRQAAAVSAERGAMSVNEQLEALELSAADPVAELVVPRVIASVVALPLLTLLGTTAATVSAIATVSLVFGADGWAFADTRYLDTSDVVCALVKALAVGLYIPLAASLRGLRAQGGAAAVGAAVTDAVVEACMGCLVIDFTVAAAFLALGA